MKLTEAIQFRQPLFESFKDLETVLSDKIDYIDRSDAEGFESAWSRMMIRLDMLDDPLAKMFIGMDAVRNVKSIKKAAQFILDHPYSTIDLTDVFRMTKGEGEDRINSILSILEDQMDRISEKANLPENRPADYEVIESGSSYKVYALYNYSAAKEMCNLHRTSHCIGSSDTSMFDEYSSDDNMDTYAISTSTGKLVIVHAGVGGYRLTDHDNKSEFSHRRETGRGMRDIMNDLVPPMSTREVKDVLSDIITDTRDYEEVTDEIDGFYTEDTDDNEVIASLGIITETEISVRKGSFDNFYLHMIKTYPRPEGQAYAYVVDYIFGSDGKVYKQDEINTMKVTKIAQSMMLNFDMSQSDIENIVGKLENIGSDKTDQMSDLIFNSL